MWIRTFWSKQSKYRGVISIYVYSKIPVVYFFVSLPGRSRDLTSHEAMIFSKEALLNIKNFNWVLFLVIWIVINWIVSMMMHPIRFWFDFSWFQQNRLMGNFSENTIIKVTNLDHDYSKCYPQKNKLQDRLRDFDLILTVFDLSTPFNHTPDAFHRHHKNLFGLRKSIYFPFNNFWWQYFILIACQRSENGILNRTKFKPFERNVDSE